MIRLPETLLEILRTVYRYNSVGSKPSLTEIGRELKISKPTIRKDIRLLMQSGYIIELTAGRKKVVELTDKARNIFTG